MTGFIVRWQTRVRRRVTLITEPPPAIPVLASVIPAQAGIQCGVVFPFPLFPIFTFAIRNSAFTIPKRRFRATDLQSPSHPVSQSMDSRLRGNDKSPPVNGFPPARE